MSERGVDVFFYGSYINFAVLEGAGIGQRPWETARLPGYRLVIASLANLEADAGSQSFGILTGLTHRELERLYTEHARDRLGGLYLPEAVVVYAGDRRMVPAMCYLSHDMSPARADSAYVKRILNPAAEYGFPDAYLKHIESFLPESP